MRRTCKRTGLWPIVEIEVENLVARDNKYFERFLRVFVFGAAKLQNQALSIGEIRASQRIGEVHVQYIMFNGSIITSRLPKWCQKSSSFSRQVSKFLP